MHSVLSKQISILFLRICDNYLVITIYVTKFRFNKMLSAQGAEIGEVS